MDMLVPDVPDLPFLKFRDADNDTYDDTSGSLHQTQMRDIQGQSAVPGLRRGNLVLVVEDRPALSSQVSAICSYVGLNVEPVASIADLG